MSLINDALNRARREQPASPPPAQTISPLQPITYQRANGVPPYVVPILLLTLSVSCWFLIKAWNSLRQASLQGSAHPPGLTVVAARESSPQSAAGPDPSVATTPPPNSPSPIPPVVASASSNFAPDAATQPQAAKPVAPAFKLHGIFFRAAHPCAVVNNKTVFVGDRIGRAKVIAITQESVRLEIDGKTEELTLP